MRAAVCILLIFSCQILNAQQFWTHTRGPVGGTVRTLVTSSDGSKIFAQTFPGGVFLSTDRGSSWRNIVEWSDFVESFFLNHPGDLLTSKWNKGLHRSTDDGLSWTKVATLSVVSFASSSKGIIFAVTRPMPIIGDDVARSSAQESFETNSFYRSADSGKSWTKIELAGLNPLSVAVSSQGILLVGTSDSVARSTDNGYTWLSTSPINGRVDGIFAGLSGTVYARANNQFLYESTDGGIVWNLIGEWDVSIRAFAADSTGNTFVGTDKGVYRRSVTGDGWGLTSLQGVQIQSLLAGKDGMLFAGSVGHGVYRSNDGGISWVHSSDGLTATFIQSFVVTPDSRILAGTRESGLLSWQNGSTAWSRNLLEDTEIRSILTLPSGNLLAAARHGIYRSTDNGFTWQITGLEGSAVYALALDSSGAILSGSYGIYLSKDHGVTWTRILQRESFPILSITVNRLGTIFGCGYGGVFSSKDSGATWKVMGVLGTVLSIASASDGSVLAAIDFGNSGIVIRSPDNGTSWYELPIYGVTALTTGANNEVFAAKGLQVFHSSDGGATWIQIANDSTDTYVDVLALDREGYIYAGTRSNGVYRSTKRVITSVEPIEPPVAYGYKLYQNFPNPFNPSTTISYQLAEDASVQFRIYDVMGREVATLVDAQKQAGYHSVQWSGKDSRGTQVSSGVYLYRFTANPANSSKPFTASGKLLLTK